MQVIDSPICRIVKTCAQSLDSARLSEGRTDLLHDRQPERTAKGRQRMIAKLKLVALAVGALAFVAGVGGTAQAQSKCQGEKIKAAGKKANCKAGLEAKQASKGGTIDPAKIAKCEAKLSSTYAKNEAAVPKD